MGKYGNHATNEFCESTTDRWVDNRYVVLNNYIISMKY